MFAVVKTGGKQYKVAENDLLKIEKIAGEAGDIITLDDVLMVGEGEKVTLGEPLVSGASVAAEILGQDRHKKIVVFKKRRRQNYRRKKGHRQHTTVLRVTEILTGGAKPSKKAAAKPAKKKAAPKADKAAATQSESKIIDDIKLIGGVGPALEKKLNGEGITSLQQIADLSAADMAAMDEKLKLGGRTEREEWAEQAKELLAGKPPRAKSDQAAAKKAETE